MAKWCTDCQIPYQNIHCSLYRCRRSGVCIQWAKYTITLFTMNLNILLASMVGLAWFSNDFHWLVSNRFELMLQIVSCLLIIGISPYSLSSSYSIFFSFVSKILPILPHNSIDLLIFWRQFWNGFVYHSNHSIQSNMKYYIYPILWIWISIYWSVYFFHAQDLYAQDTKSYHN